MVRLLQVGFLLLVVALPAAGQAPRSAERRIPCRAAAEVRRQGRDPEPPARLRPSSRQSRFRCVLAAFREGRRMGRRLRLGLGRARQASRRSWRRTWAPAPNRAKNYHLLSNFVITVNGDSATAWSRWAFVVPGERGAAISQAGRYDDTLVREDGHWRFKRRVASNDTPAPAPAPAQTR